MEGRVFVPESVTSMLERMTDRPGSVGASRTRTALLEGTQPLEGVSRWHPCFAHDPDVDARLRRIARTMRSGNGNGRGAELWLCLDQRFIEAHANFDDPTQYERVAAELPYIERTLAFLFDEPVDRPFHKRHWTAFQKLLPEKRLQLAARLAALDARLRHPLWTMQRFDLRQRIAGWLVELLRDADTRTGTDVGTLLAIAESGWYTAIATAPSPTQARFGAFEKTIAKVVSETALHAAGTEGLRLASLYHRGLARRAMHEQRWAAAHRSLHEALGALEGAAWEGFAIGARGDLASVLYAQGRFDAALAVSELAVSEAMGLVRRHQGRSGTRRLLVEGARLMLVARRTGDLRDARDRHGADLLHAAARRPAFEKQVQSCYLACLEGSTQTPAPQTLPHFLT